MPFKSKAQQKYMFKFMPKIAREFADATKNFKSLPEHVKPKKADASKKKASKAKKAK